MPKPEWGVKRTCASCGARFYDLMKDPILCPDCGATFVIETAKGGRRRAAEPESAKPSEAEDAELVEDDADVLDTSDDDDDAEVPVEAGSGSSDGDDEDETLEADDSVLLDEDEEDADLSEFGDDSDEDDRR